MFVESAFITREFREEQIPILEGVTCLSVVNTGTTIAIINGVTIYPTQKQILIPPDGTFSKVQLELNFLTSEVTNDPILIKRSFTVKERNRILLIYKKLI
ncbi:hypothetical protein IP98_00348 [Flavobacterium cauense R2A-7]|uniref:Uncharacterized protein n=1 Tax=Flavobacterium cauense R2A-7 TaxID=1341154 RepID=A0A562M611_9FLAO|nr:hypothetical protein [Flavobacterium cauense]KGO82382.1 hypothetical protein Q762_06850 [Flavobacterium cauense R2A-7]TWI15356.1 hypothetical protein IP98_00348 [Flavobacterium cauense R2A-7]